MVQIPKDCSYFFFFCAHTCLSIYLVNMTPSIEKLFLIIYQDAVFHFSIWNTVI